MIPTARKTITKRTTSLIKVFFQKINDKQLLSGSSSPCFLIHNTQRKQRQFSRDLLETIATSLLFVGAFEVSKCCVFCICFSLNTFNLVDSERTELLPNQTRTTFSIMSWVFRKVFGTYGNGIPRSLPKTFNLKSLIGSSIV